MTIQCNEKMTYVKTIKTDKKQIYSAIDVQTMVHLAAKSIAPVWPLKTFIACNSLQGFESKPFDEALNEAQALFEQRDIEYQNINRETIKWCGSYFDEGQSVIEIPAGDKGFYSVFKELSSYDKILHQRSKQNKQWLMQLPHHAEDAIVKCLNFLKISYAEQLPFLKKSLAQLPGWSGYIKWRTEWQNTSNHSGKHSNMLVDFIAIRLIITVLLNPTINLSNGFSNTKAHKHSMIDGIKKLEESYKFHLIRPLLNEVKTMNKLPPKSPDVQLVFCIDVRSEPFRRHLESLGDYETLGFAGFFGLPIRLHDYNSGKVTDSCPVLLKPRYDIHDQPNHKHSCAEKQHEQGKKLINCLTDMYQQLKYNFATPFALVETLGAWCGLLMLSKTMQPTLTLSIINKWIEKIRPTVATTPMIDMMAADSSNGISPTEQALYAEAVLRIMGLTENFGKCVIFCGHRSSTQNNPYASGLDCGACGGNHGGGNAKTLAAILNKRSIQDALYDRGIFIPHDTKFLAAEHNTTTDDVLIFEDSVPQLFHKAVLKKLKNDLQEAKLKNSTSRVSYFDVPSQNPVKETDRRSQDWSEVRPEWGLARNAAFIVAPRRLTKSLDLEGRCFLHSYDWVKDERLSSLETILTAPMVVAEWINTQYLFSTLNNVSYGSGSKVTHNVTGKIGIMQGNCSDLMHGLPLQSVNSTDVINYHQPQRLLTIIYAPRKNVSAIINRQEILKTLFFNAWVHLIVIEPTENKAYQLQTNGEWYLLRQINK